MTEGHPSFVANNGRIGFGVVGARRLRPRGRAADPAAVARRPGRRRATWRSGPGWTRTRSTWTSWAPRRSTGSRRVLRAHGAGPRRLPLPARAPVAVGAPGGRDVRARRGPPRPGAAGRRGRRVRGAAVHPHALQHHAARPALREGRARDPEHGVPAGAVAGVHAGHPGDQRLGVRPRRRATRRSRTAGSRCCASACRSATPATSTTGRPRRTRTARCSPRSGARARFRWSGRRSSWRRWPRCCTATPTATRSSRPASARRD